MTDGAKGAAAVEMAFTIVLLVWLVLGIVDVGRAIFTNIALEDAVQAAVAHAAFTPDADVGDVENAAISSNDSIDLTAADIEVACTEVERDKRDGSRVRVETVYSMPYITPLVGQALGGSIDLHKNAEAERFFEACDDLQEVPW